MIVSIGLYYQYITDIMIVFVVNLTINNILILEIINLTINNILIEIIVII